MRNAMVRDTTGRPNVMNVTYHPDGMVHIEITAQHGGEHVVHSALSLPRVMFADMIRKLGVM